MLVRASTKTFVTRVQKTAKNFRYPKNSLAGSLVSRGITIPTFYIIIVIYSNIPIRTLDRAKYRELFSVKPNLPSYMITNASQQVSNIKQDIRQSKTK